MYIAGQRIIVSPNLVDIVYTRKQRRKLTNTRWTKKYLKKYSKQVPSAQVIVLADGTIICHPATYEKLKQMEKYYV